MGTVAEENAKTERVSKRLDSWKEIAAYFGKDVRTVRRWETERDLPVHRVPGIERSGVFAYTGELEIWLRTRSEAEPQPLSTGEPFLVEAPLAESVSPARLEDVPVRSLPDDQSGRSGARRYGPLVLALGVACLSIAAIWLRGHGGLDRWAPAALRSSIAPEDKFCDPQTRDLYLRGRYQWSLRTESSLTMAIDLFTQTIVHDPHFAPAYAGLADSYLLLRQFGRMTDAEAFTRADEASKQALAQDDRSAEGHRTRAFVLNYWRWDFPAAENEFQRAIALDPRDAQSHLWYGTSLYSVGLFNAALRELDTARQIEPDSVSILTYRAYIQRMVNPETALTALLEIERDRPDFAPAHRYAGEVELQLKHYDRLLAETKQAAALPGHEEEVTVLTRAQQELVHHGTRATLTVLAKGYGRMADEPGGTDEMKAALYAAELEDTGRTLHYLELAHARRNSTFHSLPILREYDFLKKNAQFQALLARSSELP